MTNRQLQKLLQQFPHNMPLKLLLNSDTPISGYEKIVPVDLEDDHILKTSEGAWVDDEAPTDEWDHEDGKIRHKGRRYLLFNPIIT